MKKYLFSLLAVVLTSMCVLSSCGNDDDDPIIPSHETSHVSYESMVSGNFSQKLLNAFVSFINAKAEGAAKLETSMGVILISVSNQTKFNALLKNLEADSSELDAAMENADPEGVIRVSITYGDQISFKYSWPRNPSYAENAGTYKYTDDEGKVWIFELTTNAGSDDEHIKASITVPEGCGVEAKTYEGEWIYYGDVIIVSSTERGDISKLINAGFYYKKADNNKIPVTVRVNSKTVLTEVMFTKQ